eukprot:TRINITY_DN6100_c0_g1_i2.p1 TRINITY_DN6100_c0_g1~~TRINITY_DN6100_c0_g1_i2.p1  ORF type:complete len:962 (-),score=278.83 TRINITY_DN6100_c0_g1_i2:131-2596(-)
MTFASAFAFLIIGSLGLGKVVNFIPFPVRTGIFASVGYLLYKFSWELATEEDMSMDTLNEHWQLLLAAHIVGIVLFGLVFKFHHPATIPVMFFSSIFIFQIILAVTGKSAHWAREERWLMEDSERSYFWDYYVKIFGSTVEWGAIWRQMNNILMAVAVGPVLNTNINLCLLGPLLGTQPNQDKELRLHGFSNAIAGLFGGFCCNVAISTTNLHVAAGGKTRSSAIIAAIGCAIFVIVHYTFAITPLIPRTILAAFFVNFGIEFLFDALIVSAKQLNKFEYGIVLVIMLTTIFQDVSIAFALGIGISFLMFVRRYAMIDHVLFETDNTKLCSCVLRLKSHNELLRHLGKSIYIFRLQGYIFFASVFSLTDHIVDTVKQRRQRNLPMDFVILDFSQVPGVDTTAMSTILQCVRTLDEQYGIKSVMVVKKDDGISSKFKDANQNMPKITVHTNNKNPQLNIANSLRGTMITENPSTLVGDGESCMTILSADTSGGRDLDAFLSLTELMDNVVASHGTRASKWNKWLPKKKSSSNSVRNRRHSFGAFLKTEPSMYRDKLFRVFSTIDDALEFCEDAVLGIRNTGFFQAHRHSISKFVPHAGPELARWSGKWEAWDTVRLFVEISKYHEAAFYMNGTCPLLETGLCRSLYFHAGEVLFWEGDRSDGLYLLGNGRLTSYFTPYQDNENIHDSGSIDRVRAFTQELNVTEFMPESKNRLWVARHPGTPLGNLNLDNAGEVTRNDETVVAEVNTSVLHIPEKALRILSSKAPQAYMELFRAFRRLQLRKWKFLKLKMKIADFQGAHNSTSVNESSIPNQEITESVTNRR